VRGEGQGGAPGGLLAVDVGLRTGLALYGRNGRLLWVRSRHVGGLPHLRRTAAAILRETPDLARVVLEGGGPAGEIWLRAAADRRVTAALVFAETWRPRLLLDRQQRSGSDAKRFAISLARETIRWSGVTPPRTLTDDAAEAVLVGLWAVLEYGWLSQPPPFVRPPARPG
jgi:hypothetical protein